MNTEPGVCGERHIPFRLVTTFFFFFLALTFGLVTTFFFFFFFFLSFPAVLGLDAVFLRVGLGFDFGPGSESVAESKSRSPVVVKFL